MKPNVRYVNVWYDRDNPEISIIILNLNKAELTIKCLEHLWIHTTGRRFEIIVVDNGSSPADLRRLAAAPGPFTLVRLSINRYFGEGNNIGVGYARGRYIVFVNNDVFVTDHWISPLIDTLESRQDAGGVGPRFIYPDGRLQEAGAFVDHDGHAIQVGKHDIYDPADQFRERIVDYCSAACFAVRRDVFDLVGGFDYVYEPAYYEDVDLCFKIISTGRSIYYCPKATVVHIESATSSANREKLGLWNIVDVNRRIFLSRWGEWLRDRVTNHRSPPPRFCPQNRTVVRESQAGAVPALPKAVFYTPYSLVPGGGERYLLTAAAAASESHAVYLVTEESYSDLRIAALGRDFSIDVSRLRTIKRSKLNEIGEISASVTMSNAPFPPFRGFGRRNLYVSQFPFPISDELFAEWWENLESVDGVVVYSTFVKEHLERQLRRVNMAHVPVSIVYPPVALVRSPIRRTRDGALKAILIGRFFAGGHNKRHDIAIEAMRELVNAGVVAELHLVGSLHSEPVHRARYESLTRQASGLPIVFHPNATRDAIEKLLGECHVYWHATGFGIDAESHPEQCEHFGITPLEAMSAGCVPFVYCNGGPLEFVKEGQNGFLYRTVKELAEKSDHLFKNPARLHEISERARQDARAFSEEAFVARWRDLFRHLTA